MYDITMAVFGITGLLALVTLLVPLAARANVAFSLVLALAGIALGLTSNAVEGWNLGGPLGNFLVVLGQFDLSSEAFILVFLPALLFETALVIDVRRLMDDIAPILLLAVVAVLLSTFMVGFGLSTVAGIGVVPCLLLAAILSTTDPIAVVAIFRDLGVPHRLSLLVEGESLFNDAAAISLFTLFLGMVTGDRQPDFLDGAATFLRGFVGGLLMGYVSGRMVCWGFSLLRGQRSAQITVTVSAAYLVFLLGEHYLHVSGVVAVVTTALVISYYGRTQVVAETWASLVDVWQQVAYWASSLIFLLATMRVPGMLAGMGPGDFGLLAVLIVTAMAARALVLFGLFPVLTAVGWSEPVGVPLRAVVLWGGLRGAISLALALAVVENPKVPPEVKSFVAVLCTAFVLSTLFINAPLLRPLIRLLGLDRLSPADMAVRGRAIATTLATVRQRVSDAALGYGIDHQLAVELAESYTKRLGAAEAQVAGQLSLNCDEEVRGGLAMLAEREQAIYLRHFREGIVSGSITRSLLAVAARLQDGVKTGGAAGYVAAHQATIAFPLRFRAAMALHRRFGFDRPLAGEIANRFEILLMLHAAIGKLAELAERKLPAVIGPDAASEVKALVAARLDAVETALAALRLQYADFSRALQLQYLERAAVRIEEAEYRRLRSEAVIGHEVFNDLQTDLRERAHRLDRRPPIDLQLEPEVMVARVPPFGELPPGELSQITRLLRPLLALPGEVIVRKGDVGDAMYFIASGAVEVHLSPAPVRLGSGEFFGELALITRSPRSADVVSLGFCSLLVLDAPDFEALLQASPELRSHIHETARQRLARDVVATAT
ncbi:MAG: cation:proton antiporter [Rhodospirillaceae bacterium]|nr:cation:proton antiporter [Rhodospirillales bacterium]